MARRPNYGGEKRQKELQKQKKKEEKAEKKRLRKEEAAGGEGTENEEGTFEAEDQDELDRDGEG